MRTGFEWCAPALSARRIAAPLLLAAATLFAGPSAMAMPVPTGLVINATVDYDSDGYSTAVGGVTQGGNMSITDGGTSSSSTISNGTATPNTTITRQLSETGDGTSINLSLLGVGPSDDIAYNIADQLISLSNASASDIYTVSLRVDVRNFADATGSETNLSESAYVLSDFRLCDSARPNCSTELMYSALASDSYYGDSVGGTPQGTKGATLSDSGSQLFIFVLNPGDMLDLWGEMRLEALNGSPNDGIGFNANLTSSITLESVEVTDGNGGGGTVPEPAAALLVSLGLGLLGWQRRSRRQ